jgi:drug/metabolite transporter (DMT)-like permease
MATFRAAAASRSPDARSRLLGIGLVVASTFIFGLSNVLVKWSMTEYPVGEALFIRSVVAFAMIAPFLRLSDVLAAARISPGMQLLRMTLSALEIGCYYWAIASLQLADVSAFYLSSPIMLTALSALVLRESVDRARWLAIVVGFAGVLVALQPSAHAVSWPACVALTGSAMYAVILTTTRSLRRTPNLMLVALQLVSVMVAGAVTMPFAWVTPTPPALLVLSVVGLVSIVGSILQNRALQLAPASVIAPFQYASIIWAIILGYVAFDDIPDAALLAGATIIVGAGLFIFYRERMAAAALAVVVKPV